VPEAVVAAAPPTVTRSSVAVGAIAAVAVIVLGVGAVMLARKPDKPQPRRDLPPVAAAERRGDPAAQVTKIKTDPGTARPAAALNAVARREGPLRVAVLKFQNVGKDPQLSALEQGIGETAVSTMAGATAAVQLIERSDLDSEIGEIDRGKDEHFDKLSMAKLGQLEGIQIAVQGGFQRAGKALRITARFIRVETGEVIDTLTVTRPVRQIFAAQDEVARGLSQKLQAIAAKEAAR
jgi:TolB-like protein